MKKVNVKEAIGLVALAAVLGLNLRYAYGGYGYNKENVVGAVQATKATKATQKATKPKPKETIPPESDNWDGYNGVMSTISKTTTAGTTAPQVTSAHEVITHKTHVPQDVTQTTTTNNQATNTSAGQQSQENSDGWKVGGNLGASNGVVKGGVNGGYNSSTTNNSQQSVSSGSSNSTSKTTTVKYEIPKTHNADVHDCRYELAENDDCTIGDSWETCRYSGCTFAKEKPKH